MEQRRFSDQIADFIGELRQEHRGNEQRGYYAKDQSGQLISIRPVFVSEFIIYNSLYQVDWSDSLHTGCIKNNPGSFTETKQQEKFEQFLKPYIQESPILLYKAFLPIHETTLEDHWLEVAPSLRISAGGQSLLEPTPSQGKHFFRRLRELQSRLPNTDQPSEFQVDDSLFELIRGCRYYIYQIRNNIFHGSKTLGETYDPEQRKRICIYLTFLRCMINLFFSVCDRHLLRTASNFSTEA